MTDRDGVGVARPAVGSAAPTPDGGADRTAPEGAPVATGPDRRAGIGTEEISELDLFRRFRATGDRRVRNALVERRLALIEPHVRRFGGRGIAREDLRQVAFLALLAAVERFDPELGVSFSTFAGRTIEGELKRFLRDRSWAVRPPRRQQEVYLHVRQAEDALLHRLGRSPTVRELAAEVGESEDLVLEALEAGGARQANSLDAPTPRGTSMAERVLGVDDNDYARVEVRLVVERLMRSLDERERSVIALRFFDDLGQPEIAERLGLSQSYVSRLIRRILASMREELERGSVAGPVTLPDAVTEEHLGT